MKTRLIISAILTVTHLFLIPGSFAESNKNASVAPHCKSCRQAAAAGKKKATIKSSQKTGSVLFDGVDPDLPAKDFAPDSSNPAALTGKGGLLLDLKAAEPEIGKVSQATDFSLDKPTLEFTKTALLPQKAEAASDPVYDGCVKLRQETIKRFEEEIIRFENLELTWQNVFNALVAGQGVCAPAAVASKPEDCTAGINSASEWIANAQAGKAAAQAGLAGLPTEIESCGCRPGTNPVNGGCQAEEAEQEPEAETEDDLGHDFPYGELGWASIIGILAGIGLILGGSVWGNLVLIISGLLFVLVSIGGLILAKRWAERKVAEIKKIQIKQIIEGDLNQTSAVDLQKAGKIESNAILRNKYHLTDDDLRWLGLL